MRKRLEIKAGDPFGRWTVLEEVEPHVTPCGSKIRMFKCRCKCGTVRNIAGSSLNAENSTSCGCYRAELAIENNTTHGGGRTWLYREWLSAKHRSKKGGYWQKRHPTYVGVDIDPEWESSFEAFRDWALSRPDYAEDKELDRIDNTKGYYPWNCRWTDRKRQMRNTSITRMYNGTPLIDIYERECDCGITYKAFYHRVVKMGWDVQTALHKVTRKSRRAMNTNNRRNTLRTMDGASVADIYNTANYRAVSYSCFAYRIKAGWDISAALTTKSKKSKK